MTKTVLSLLCTALLWGASPAAHADDWAELSWQARWGDGVISYRRDVASTTAPDGTTTFADSIGYFNVLGWEFPAMRGHRFIGGGGDIITRTTQKPGCDPAFDTCTTTSLVFKFDTPYPDLYPSWQLNTTFEGPLDATGLLPVSDEGTVGTLLAHLSNNRTTLTLTTLDGSVGPMNRAIAAPVPEPATLAMLALGAGLAAVTAGRRRADRRSQAAAHGMA